MDLGLKGKTALVTGASAGIGEGIACELAKEGVRLALTARSGSALAKVADAIAATGAPLPHVIAADITRPDSADAIASAALAALGRVDILVNNAGILRDKTFAKMEMADFRAVIDVHLIGTATCTKAVWEIMRQQTYGRIVCTSSPSGLHGIFGQANYGAAKAAMIGFMNALHLEGAKYNVRVNLLSPSARTRMTEDIGIPEPILAQLTPEAITAALLFLVSEDAPSRAILSCAGGGYARAYVAETQGVYFPPAEQTPENIASSWETISDPATARYYADSSGPLTNFMTNAQNRNR
jgi:NAD(P)-dependent dehydrogenase (short-subunit alcohol dehydrogenase family)